MKLRDRRSRRTEPRVEFTPLIDCAFILIIFFAASTTMITTQTGMKVNLPKAATAEKMPEHVQIAIDENMAVYYNDLEVNEDTLGQMVKNRIAKEADVPFIIGAARSVPYEKLISVLDIVRKSGGTKLSLQTEKKYEPETKEETNQ